MSILGNLSEPVKSGVDALSVGAALGTLLGYLPQVTALLGAIWLLLRLVIGWQEFRLNQRRLRK